jgi:hypothetical protein
MRNIICASALLISVAVPVTTSAADTSLAAARDLYVSASYDDALAMLSALSNGSKSMEERQSIDLYRTLCLFAVGKTADADKVIEAMLLRDPLYRAGDEELSPRVETAFQTARRRILPSVIQQKYAEAKAAFDKQEWATASTGFAEVLKSIADPDIAAAVGAPPLSDIKTLSAGFRDLAVKSTPPPPPAPKAVAEVKPVRPVKAVYTPDDRDVLPPVAIVQRVPKYPANVTRPLQGVVQFVVDENGAVQTPTMPVSIDMSYDGMVISAAKKWQYTPATLDGKPVKYMKRLTISVSVTPPQQGRP